MSKRYSGGGAVTHSEATEPSMIEVQTSPPKKQNGLDTFQTGLSLFSMSASTASLTVKAASVAGAVPTGGITLFGYAASKVLDVVALGATVVNAGVSLVRGDLEWGDVAEVALATAGALPVPVVSEGASALGIAYGAKRLSDKKAKAKGGRGITQQAGATFVVDGALIMCPFGAAVQSLKILPARRVKRGALMANIQDCTTVVNIPLFGTCIAKPLPSGNPGPCTPACVSWLPGKPNVLVEGQPALLGTSMAICSAGGGTVIIQFDGQI